jgi:tripartite-type tricarboxylate transporter receptor subunit TctC
MSEFAIDGCRMLHIVLIVFGLLGASPATAQVYPSREIRVILPFPLSGPTDIRGTPRMTKSYKLIASAAPPSITDFLGRLTQQALLYESKFPVTLERQPGGLTTRGAQHVARARPDGHTLLLASNATMVLLPNFLRHAGYDPIGDFETVAPLAGMRFVLMASAGLPVRRLDKLIDYVRMRPGEVNFGSSGEGSTGHLAGELLRRAAKLDMVHVSYNGGLAALDGLAKGHTSLAFVALPLALPYANNRHVRAIAIAGEHRLAMLPGVPTLAESGVAGVNVAAWYGVFAPRGVTPSALRWLSERIVAATGEPATGEDLARLGLESPHGSLSGFATRVYSEIERWGPVLKAARIPRKDV